MSDTYYIDPDRILGQWVRLRPDVLPSLSTREGNVRSVLNDGAECVVYLGADGSYWLRSDEVELRDAPFVPRDVAEAKYREQVAWAYEMVMERTRRGYSDEDIRSARRQSERRLMYWWEAMFRDEAYPTDDDEPPAPDETDAAAR